MMGWLSWLRTKRDKIEETIGVLICLEEKDRMVQKNSENDSKKSK